MCQLGKTGCRLKSGDICNCHTGRGGEIGEKRASLASGRKVVCDTHPPQARSHRRRRSSRTGEESTHPLIYRSNGSLACGQNGSWEKKHLSEKTHPVRYRGGSDREAKNGAVAYLDTHRARMLHCEPKIEPAPRMLGESRFGGEATIAWGAADDWPNARAGKWGGDHSRMHIYKYIYTYISAQSAHSIKNAGAA